MKLKFSEQSCFFQLPPRTQGLWRAGVSTDLKKLSSVASGSKG
jgi:hypothetical protein